MHDTCHRTAKNKTNCLWVYFRYDYHHNVWAFIEFTNFRVAHFELRRCRRCNDFVSASFALRNNAQGCPVRPIN